MTCQVSQFSSMKRSGDLVRIPDLDIFGTNVPVWTPFSMDLGKIAQAKIGSLRFVEEILQ